MKSYLGIDPGWATFGFAQVDEDGNLVKSWGSVPRSLGLSRFIIEKLPKVDPGSQLVCERYVAYEGNMNSATEILNMMIGAIQFYYESEGTNVKLVRAVEWKTALCKWLVHNKGFKNPSTRFDKVFSKAAAECLSGKPIKSDHEADAICLAYVGWINGRAAKTDSK